MSEAPSSKPPADWNWATGKRNGKPDAAPAKASNKTADAKADGSKGASIEDLFSKLGSGAIPGMEGARVMKPEEMNPFEKGDSVTITGLAKKPELNGKEGTVLGTADGGRLPVKLKDGTSIKVKPANLKRSAASQAASEAANEQLRKQAEKLPIYFDYKGNLKFAADASESVPDRCACLKTLVGHAQSQEPSHHEKLIDAGFHTTMLELIACPATSVIVEVSDGNSSDNSNASTHAGPPSDVTSTAHLDDDELANALRLGAIACMQEFCHRADNVKAVVSAGVIATLLPLLARPPAGKMKPPTASKEEHGSDARFGAVDLLGSLSNHHEGKLAIGTSAPCLAALCAICRDGEAAPFLQEGAMHTLGQLLYNQECWQPLQDAGAITAAVTMLRNSASTWAGAQRATGMLYLNMMTGFANQVKDEPGAMEALHHTAQGRHGAEAAATASKAVALMVEKSQKAAPSK